MMAFLGTVQPRLIQQRGFVIAFGVANLTPWIALASLYLAGAAYNGAVGRWPAPGDRQLLEGAWLQQATYLVAWASIVGVIIGGLISAAGAFMLGRASERPVHPFDWILGVLPLFAARGFFPNSYLILAGSLLFAPCGFAWRRLPRWAARLVALNALGLLWFSNQIDRDPLGLFSWLIG